MIHRLLITLGLLVVSLARAETGAHAEKTFADVLADVRQPLSLTSGKLSGSGAAEILAAIHPAPFVLIGEDHGIAQIPAFSAALFDELAPLGFKDLVVEVGPTAAHQVDKMLHGPNPEAEMRNYVQRYPFSLAFYNMNEEFAFLKHARDVVGPDFKLIGIDQELMGSGGLILETLLSRHRTDAISGALAAQITREHAAYQQAAVSGNPTQLYMMTAERGELETLGVQLSQAGDEVGSKLVGSLLASRDIYAARKASVLDSNARRGVLMKQQWVAQSRAGSDGRPGKTVFKFGAAHVMKGFDMFNTREIGNYVAELADATGTTSVHILIVAVKGNQLRFAGVGKPMRNAPVDQVGPGQSDFPFAKPMFESALQHSTEWSVFDFRALRDYANRNHDLDARMARMIFAFDFAVVIPEAQPSTEIQ